MTAYYNEHDPFAAAWLRELIADGLIAPGEVDERSMEDVRPDELTGFVQCHFFAGIGVWSYALRRAGISDDYPLWTGSCPCQPFSEAGKRSGTDDERHLWPAWHWLIKQRSPGIIFGEQVASKDGLGWRDLVHSDLEGEGYSVAATDLCAACVGAPQRRQRIYFVANADRERQPWRPQQDEFSSAALAAPQRNNAGRCSPLRSLADTTSSRPLPAAYNGTGDGDEEGWARSCEPQRLCVMGDTNSQGHEIGVRFGRHDAIEVGAPERQAALEAGFVRGFWSDARWIKCFDPDGPRYRAIEPSTFPLAHGAPARVGRLRGYGNAINAEVASAFIEEAIAAIASLTEKRAAA